MDVKTVSKPAVQPAPTPKRSVDQNSSVERQPKPQEKEQRQEAQAKPNPVVNAQGQVTGRHLNVTA